jgi:polyphosphate kinase 2 (PPK2 family)
VLNRTSTPWAPWHVVPADRKWFRDYVVAQMVVDTMEEWNLKWPKPRADLRKFRVK